MQHPLKRFLTPFIKWGCPIILLTGCSFAQVDAPIDPIAEKHVTELAPTSNRFGLQLFTKLAESTPEQNLFISPISLSVALTMTYNGAEGKTKEEMSRVLGWDGKNLEEVNKHNEALLTLLANGDPKVQVKIANSIWAEASQPFNPDFQKRCETSYKAEVKSMPKLESQETVEAVNGWVKDKTSGMIPEIVKIEHLTNVRAILANAIYFKGVWTEQFDKKATYESNFILANNNPVQVQMMHRKGDYKLLREKEFQAICLPYGGERYSFYVFLPNPDSSLKAFMTTLTDEKWQKWMKGFKEEKDVQLSLPRFKAAYGEDMKKILSDLGMETAFLPGKADFSGMGFKSDIWIGHVLHKAALEVDEEGTKASAATVVVMQEKGIQRENTFAVNRPFLCAIRDNKTGTDLFLGAIYEPK